MSDDPLQGLIHEGIAVVPIGVLEPEVYNGIFELFARFYKLGREHGEQPPFTVTADGERCPRTGCRIRSAHGHGGRQV